MNICWKDAETDEIVDVEYVLLDGYGIGDRFLEGVQFRCKPFLDEKGDLNFEVTLGPDEQAYLKSYKASVSGWCEEMRKYAVSYDIYTHPESGRDLYYDLGHVETEPSALKIVTIQNGDDFPVGVVTPLED